MPYEKASKGYMEKGGGQLGIVAYGEYVKNAAVIGQNPDMAVTF